jgi:hypothetical protein
VNRGSKAVSDIWIAELLLSIWFFLNRSMLRKGTIPMTAERGDERIESLSPSKKRTRRKS